MITTEPLPLPPYDLFMGTVEILFSPEESERIGTAYIFSKYGHAGQERQGGDRYFDHPKAVAWSGLMEFGCRDAHCVILDLLHDLKEDAYLLSPRRLALNFGEVAALDILGLTKMRKGKETTAQYLGRVIDRGPRAIFSKLKDRIHNVRTLGDCAEEKRKRQCAETRTHHMPLLLPALRSHGAPWSGYADLAEAKLVEALSAHQ